MPMVQTLLPDDDVARLERYRQGLELPTSRTAVIRAALRQWLDTHEQQDTAFTPFPPLEIAHDRPSAR